MEFKIRETGAGLFEIIQSQPVVIGSFPEKDMARKVMSFLVDDAMSEAETEPRKPASSILRALKPTQAAINKRDALKRSADRLSPPFEPLPPTDPEPIKRKPSKQPAAEDTAVIGSDAEWLEAELNDAFARLADGEKLRVVADHFGKSWTKLRAKWATQKKSYVPDPPAVSDASGVQLPAVVSDEKSPLAMVTTALAEMKDQSICNLCGRHFSMTPDNLDTCMRCQNGS